MKIVIDVDKLLEEGRITTEEYERLNALAVKKTGSLAFNILIGFGVIATAGGALARFLIVTLLCLVGSVRSWSLASPRWESRLRFFATIRQRWLRLPRESTRRTRCCSRPAGH